MRSSCSCAVAPSPSNLDTAPKANSENAGEAGLKEPVEGDVGTTGGDEGLLDSASTVQESAGKGDTIGSTAKSETAEETPISESTPPSGDSVALDAGNRAISPSLEPSPAPSEPPISTGGGISE